MVYKPTDRNQVKKPPARTVTSSTNHTAKTQSPDYVGIINRTIEKPETDELLSNKEAADYIGVAPGTLEVWRCTKRYHIPHIKLGNRLVKYRKSALDAFLESRTVGAEG
ncbi:helix-turn-helix transcriptional regulator [Methylomonas koyamae]|uniref:helix-turn-helix transcriptional regulator n=1 Tax=Methylomonas koyamae TaxID=702114 RepID=UPI000BC30465|nr:helix-turn-helix domain-containing protein [Methylomonas koyamae]ATG89707.1 excisionase [Methylomonas koyamae]